MPADIDKLITLVDRKQPEVRQLAYLIDGIVEANREQVLNTTTEWLVIKMPIIAKACTISRLCPTIIDEFETTGKPLAITRVPACLVAEIQQAYRKLTLSNGGE